MQLDIEWPSNDPVVYYVRTESIGFFFSFLDAVHRGLLLYEEEVSNEETNFPIV